MSGRLPSVTAAAPFQAISSDDVARIELGAGCIRRDLPCAAGLRVWIVEMAAGSIWPEVDAHPEGEAVYVLEGELIEGSQRYPAGSYLDFQPGSSHRPRTDTGVKLFGFNPATSFKEPDTSTVEPPATQKRVQFDFFVTFQNGGNLRGEGFRLDIGGDDISTADLGDYIIRDMRLLMVATVEIHNKTIICERHKRRNS